MSALELYGGSVVDLALSLPRIVVAFIVLPLMSGDIVPPMVRNVFTVVIALSLLPLLAGAGPVGASSPGILSLFLKEAFIGLAIAFTFSIFFWALEGAGEIIDAKIGTTLAQIVDPVLGHQTTLTATFFARLAAFLFVASGGLQIFIGLLLQSYLVWPVDAALPVLDWSSDVIFVTRFSDLVVLMLLLASPALVLLSLVEFGFGLVNRFAERLNVFSLSFAVKAWLSTFIIIVVLGVIVEQLLHWLASQTGLLDELQRTLS